MRHLWAFKLSKVQHKQVLYFYILMKKKYLLGVSGHICSACLKANTTIMPVYTCLYSSAGHTKQQNKDRTAWQTQHRVTPR